MITYVPSPMALPRKAQPERANKMSRLKRELEAARRISQALSQHIHVDELVEQALRTALEVVDAEAGSVLLANPDAKQLVFRHVIGTKADQLRGMRIPSDQGIAGVVFTSGEPQVTRDVTRDQRHLARVDASIGYTTRDMITLPLKLWEGSPIGVLQVLNKRRGRLSEEDVSILSIISALTAAAIEQARSFEQSKLAEVGRLLGDIGHDISNMLTPVICGVGLLQSNFDSVFEEMPPAEAQRTQPTRELCGKVITMMQDNVRHLKDRVKEIADCVKGLSTPPRFAPCRLAEVVGGVVQTLRFVAEGKGIALNTHGLDNLPALMADERRLYVALYNLVNNALAEVPQGGSITIRGKLDQSKSRLQVSVIDTGRGMPPEVRDSLFTARAISRKVGGTGLGTKIVKDVIEAHAGTVRVESQEGVGTTFHLSLPLKQQSSSPKVLKSSSSRPDDLKT
jgi:signal transduction histidine kinase